MKTKIVAWICLLSMIVTFTGCKKTKDSNENDAKESMKESYLEQKISQPKLESNERRVNITSNDKNQMEYYTVQSTDDYLNSTYNCYTLVEGNYQKQTIDWANKAASDFGFDPVDYCHGQDGEDYILYMKPIPNDQVELEKLEYGVIKESQDSKGYVDITPDYWKAGTFISNLQVTKNQILCYNEDGYLIFYDPIKQEEVDYGNFETYQNYVIQGETLYYIPNDGMEIQVVQLSDDKFEKIALESKSTSNYLQVSSEGDVILLDNIGIHQYKKGGTMWETIVDGRQLSMSAPSYMIDNFVLVPGTYNTYYVLYYSTKAGQEDLFASYQYAKNVTDGNSSDQSMQNKEMTNQSEITDSPKKELTIYAVWPNITLDQAIYEYTQLHKDVKINLITASTLEDIRPRNFDPIKQYDAIMALNTEILAGNGADIILMDGLPSQKYIEKGVLMDMSDCFADLQKENSLVMNIANNYIQDGKIYCMPIKFFMPVYLMREDIAEHTKSIEDLATFCQNSKKKLIEPLCYKSLVQMFLYTYGNEIFSKEGVLMEDNLSSFLSSMNEIAIQTGATEDGSEGIFYNNTYPFSGTTHRMKSFLCGERAVISKGDILSSISYCGDSYDFTYIFGGTKLVNGSYTSVNETFVPNAIISINNNTKEAELAKSFVSFLFTEDIQSQHNSDGFPMNDRALTAWSQEPYNKNLWSDVYVYNSDGSQKSVIVDAFTVEEQQKGIELARTLTKPVFSDTVCLEMIISGTVEFLKGEKTLEQAVDEISRKVNLYQSE